jgi:hypothetical protein
MLSTQLTIPPAATLNAVAARTVQVAGARTVVPITFGTDIVPGRVLNVLPAATGSATLLVQVLWGRGPVLNVELARLNDVALPAGSTETHFTGSQTTTHAPLVAAMAAQGITYTATLNGFAYSVFAIPVRAFTGQLQFSARINGLLLYDPRLDSTVAGGSGPQRLATPSTWAFSANPALADARWLWDATFGCGETVNWASVITAANACNALIGSPAEPRRVIGLTISQPVRVADMAEAMRAYAGCWHVPSAAGITLVPDTTGSSVATYSHAAGNLLRIGALSARDIGGAPTAVEVLWTDTSRRPVRDGAPAIAQLPGAGTTLPYRLSQVRLPGVTRYSQAVREATERLNKLTLGDLGTEVEVLDEGIRHEAGDLITLTHPVGLSAKVFRVASAPEMISRGRWRMSVVEYDPAMYSTAVATAPTVPDTLLINPAGPPPDLTGMTAVAIQGAIRLSWPQKPVADIECAELRVTPTGGTAAAGTRPDTGAAGTMDIDAATYDWAWPAAGGYVIWARWRDRDGNPSVNWTPLPITVTAAGIGIAGSTLIGGTAASSLVTTAAQAATDAAAATAALAAINADGVLTPSEKPRVIVEVQKAQDEYAGLVALGTARMIGAELAAYTTAYSNLNSHLGTLTTPVPWNDTSGNTTITSTLDARITGYFAARQALLNRIESSNVAGQNMTRNSSFEVDSDANGLADQWNAYSTGSTGAITYSRLNAGGRRGSFYQRITAASLGSTASDRAGLFADHNIDGFGGRSGWWSIWAFPNLGNGWRPRLFVEFLNSSNAVIGTWDTGELPTPAANAWIRHTVSGTIPAAAVLARGYYWIQRNAAAALSVVSLDDALFTIGEILPEWTGRGDELLPGVATDIDSVAVSSFSGSVTAGQFGVIRKWVVARLTYTNPSPYRTEVEFTADMGVRSIASAGVFSELRIVTTPTANEAFLNDTESAWPQATDQTQRNSWARRATVNPGASVSAELWLIVTAINGTSSGEALGANIRLAGVKA